MKKALSICLAGVLLLSGCGKAKTNNGIQNSDYEYDTLSNVSASMTDALSKDYDHLIISDTVCSAFPEKIGSYKLVQADDYYDYIEDIISFFLGDKYSVDDAVTFGGNTEDEYKNIENESTGLVLNIDRNGEVGYIENKRAMNYRMQNSDGEYELVFLDGEYADRDVIFKDKTVKLSEAVDFAQKYIDEYTAMTGGNKQTPERAYIESYGKKQVVIFEFVQNIDGIDTATFTTRCTTTTESDTPYAEEYGTLITLMASDEVGYFSDLDGERKLTETVKEYDKIITLGSALSALDDNIAENSQYELKSVSIEALQIMESNPRQDDEGFKWTISGTNYGTILSAEPYWCFALYSKASHTYFDAAVNCVNGEFYWGREIT